MSMGDAIETRSSREVYANRWLRLREDEIVYPDGSIGIYTVVDKADFAMVLPSADGGFWLVQQFRYPVGRREWEFPQGAWPTGRDGTPEQLAAAELAEETGFTAGRVVHLGRLYASYGYSSQSYDVFLGADLTAGDPNREHSEGDMVHAWRSEDEVRSMISSGEFRDSHSVAGLALLDQYRRAAGS